MIGKLDHTQVPDHPRHAHLLEDPLRAGLEQGGDLLRARAKLVQTESAGSAHGYRDRVWETRAGTVELDLPIEGLLAIGRSGQAAHLQLHQALGREPIMSHHIGFWGLHH